MAVLQGPEHARLGGRAQVRRRPARRPSGPRPRPPSGRSTPAAAPPPRGWPGRGRPGRTPPAGPGLLGHPVDVGGGHQHVVGHPGQPGQPLAAEALGVAHLDGQGGPRLAVPEPGLEPARPGAGRRPAGSAPGGRRGARPGPAAGRRRPGWHPAGPWPPAGPARAARPAGDPPERGAIVHPDRADPGAVAHPRHLGQAPTRVPGVEHDAEAHQTSGWGERRLEGSHGPDCRGGAAVAGDLAARVLPPAARGQGAGLDGRGPGRLRLPGPRGPGRPGPVPLRPVRHPGQAPRGPAGLRGAVRRLLPSPTRRVPAPRRAGRGPPRPADGGSPVGRATPAGEAEPGIHNPWTPPATCWRPCWTPCATTTRRPCAPWPAWPSTASAAWRPSRRRPSATTSTDPAPGRAVPAAGHGPGRQRGRRRGGPPRPRGAGPADRGLPPPAGRAAAPPHGGQRRRPPGGRALPRAAARGRRLPRRQRQPAPRAAPGRPAPGPQAGLPGGPEAPAAAHGRLDVRRTVRRSLSSGGVPVDPAFRAVRASSPTCTCSPTSPAR